MYVRVITCMYAPELAGGGVIVGMLVRKCRVVRMSRKG